MTKKMFYIKAFWDKEARVWVADSDDVPGLVTEAETIEKLIVKLQTLIPELLEANSSLDEFKDCNIPFYLLTERFEIAKCGVN